MSIYIYIRIYTYKYHWGIILLLRTYWLGCTSKVQPRGNRSAQHVATCWGPLILRKWKKLQTQLSGLKKFCEMEFKKPTISQHHPKAVLKSHFNGKSSLKKRKIPTANSPTARSLEFASLNIGGTRAFLKGAFPAPWSHTCLAVQAQRRIWLLKWKASRKKNLGQRNGLNLDDLPEPVWGVQGQIFVGGITKSNGIRAIFPICQVLQRCRDQAILAVVSVHIYPLVN